MKSSTKLISGVGSTSEVLNCDADSHAGYASGIIKTKVKATAQMTSNSKPARRARSFASW